MTVNVARWRELNLPVWEAYRDGRIQDRHLKCIALMTTEELDNALGVSPEELEKSTHGVL